MVALAALTLLGGFGRFGRIHDDGLLTLNVSPTSFRTVSGYENLSVQWKADGWNVHSLDGTQKTLVREARSGPRRLEWSLLYPGIEASAKGVWEWEFNRPVVLSSIPAVGMTLTEIRCPNHSFPPIVVRSISTSGAVVPRLVGQKLVWDSRYDYRLRILTPAGIQTQFSREDAIQWAGRAIPKIRAHRKEGDFDVSEFTGSYAPLPPILDLVPRSLQAIPQGAKPGPLTRWGRLWYVGSNQARVKLPPLSSQKRGYILSQVQVDQHLALVNDLKGDMANTWATNAVDLAYSRRTPSLMAIALFPKSTREELMRQMDAGVQQAFEPLMSAWKQQTEPVSGTTFDYSYALPGPLGMRYDIEWGNMLPVYGTYQLTLADGKWERIKAIWPQLKRASKFLDLSQDWAWMAGVNADHGFSTGTGDALNAGYVGAVAMAEMAKRIGKEHDARHYEWMARRNQLALLARLESTRFASKHALIAPNRIALGFHENEHYTRTPLDGDPWYPVTHFSGNGVFPELFQTYTFHVAGLKEVLALLVRSYPTWYDGDQKYRFKTTYNGNSAYVTFPHLFARLWAGEVTPDQAWEKVNQMAGNKTHSWVAPNVLAEIMARDSGLVLTDWEDLGFQGGTIKGDVATLNFMCGKAGKRTLSWESPSNQLVRAVSLDGKNHVAVTGGSFEIVAPEGEFKLFLKL